MEERHVWVEGRSRDVTESGISWRQANLHECGFVPRLAFAAAIAAGEVGVASGSILPESGVALSLTSDFIN